MRISDLRIGVKLGVGFLAVVLFTALLGAISVVQLSRMYGKTEEMATNLLPSVAQAGELRVLLNRRFRSAVRLGQPGRNRARNVPQQGRGGCFCPAAS